MNTSNSNVDPAELAKFSDLAHRWWDPESEFRPLHQINPLRLEWIQGLAPLAGQRALDVGCGGGILSEPLARMGAKVTGIDPAPGNVEIAAAPLATDLVLPVVPPGLPSALLERRPDVVAAQHAMLAANARIGFAKAARYPSFTLTGALGTESRTFGGLFQSETATSDLGLDLRAPLFDAGRLAARVDVAIAAQHQAVAAYEGAARNAFREVRDALAEVRETALAAEAAARRETAATEALRVATARGSSGQAPPQELLEARRAHAESQFAVARVRQDRLEAQLALIRALGGARPEQVPPVR